MKLSVSFRLLDLEQSVGLRGWVISSSQGLCYLPRVIVMMMEKLVNERFWQGKPKYSEKTCLDATLSTTNPTFRTRARTRAAAVGSQRLTASVMVLPKSPSYTSLISVAPGLLPSSSLPYRDLIFGLVLSGNEFWDSECFIR
jgi:hypothetical protein